MMGDVMSVLSQLGLLPVIQFVGVTVAAVFIYRDFTDKG